MKPASLKKTLCLGLLSIIAATAAYGRHLTPEEALSRIQSQQNQRISGVSRYSLIHSEDIDGEPMVYVFNKATDGFIVVSADDSMPALLGYSDAGAFVPESASPALKWWLSQYAEEAATTLSLGFTRLNESENNTRATFEREKIPQLISTQWGQGNPYNLDCPEIDGQKCVTGCVATAMAQIIRYHQYPQSGNSSHKYPLSDNNFAATHDSISYDYGSARFDYAEMIDNYSSSATDEQRKAVANLMYACGVAVDMEYSTRESSASDTYISYALREYFNYDNDVRLMMKAFFSTSQWEDLIYSELKEKRPVIMGGQAPGGGHQFICDGYEGDGYFHINWGWEGLGDGNFLLTALNPPVQGTGGHNGGYNSNQTVICGIQPAVEGTPVWYPVYSNGNLRTSNPRRNDIEVSFDSTTGILNYSQQSFEVDIIIKAVSKDGKEYFAEPVSPFTFQGAVGINLSGYGGLGTMNLPKDLPAGDYKCYIVMKTPDGNIQEIMFPYTTISYFCLNLSQSGVVTCSDGEPEAKAEVRVTRFEPRTAVVAGEQTTFDITVENIGDLEYDGNVQFKMYPDGSSEPVELMNIGLNSIAPGSSVSGGLAITFPQFGDFDIIFFDIYGERISETFKISILESGVDAIMNENSVANVYSISGTLIKSDAGKDFLENLPKGLYIIKSNGRSVTVIK